MRESASHAGAYSVPGQDIGEGPPDILLLDQWFGHVDAQWDVPPVAAAGSEPCQQSNANQHNSLRSR